MQLDKVNLQGAIAELLTDLFMINDGFSAGGKLTEVEKKMKKRFFDASEEEIYNALRQTVSSDYYSDTFYTPEELKKLEEENEPNAN